MSSGIVIQQEITRENFPVKCISGVKKDICIFYKVHWAPSWEREDCLVGCESLIELYKFQEKNELYNGKKGNKSDDAANNNLQDEHVSSSSSPQEKEWNSAYVRRGPVEPARWDNGGDNNLAAVHNITGIFQGKDDYTYYKVEWTPTWEREDSMVGCGNLIKYFFEIELQIEVAGRFGTEERCDSMNQGGQSVNQNVRHPLPFIQIKQEPLSPQPQEENHHMYNEIDHVNSTADSSVNDGDIEQIKLQNKAIKFQYDELQKSFEEYGRERETAIRMLSKQNKDLQESFDNFKNQNMNEVSMLAKKNEDIKEKFDNYKNEKESEIEILLERNKDLREKFNKNGQENSMLQKKFHEGRQKLEQYKIEKESEIRSWTEKVEDITEKLDALKNESTREVGLLTNKCQEIKEKHDQYEREKAFEIKLLSEKNEDLREKFENYTDEKETENALLSKKNEDFKAKFDNYKKQKENDTKVFTKKIEDRREVLDKYKTQKLNEIATLIKKNDDLKEKLDNYKNQKENEINTLHKSKEEIIESFESYKSQKEAEVLSLKKQQESLGDAFDNYKIKQENEIGMLNSTNEELNKRLVNYKGEKQNEINILIRKVGDINEQLKNCKSEKEKEISLVVKKNEELKERFDKYKNEKDKEILVLLNKNEDARERFRRYENEKQREIGILSKKNEGKGKMIVRNIKDDKKIEVTDEKKIEIDILLKQNEDIRQEFENYKSEVKIELGNLMMKNEDVRGKFDVYKLEKGGEAGVLLKQVVNLHAKIRTSEEEIQSLTRENGELKIQHGAVKKKLKRFEDEKEKEVAALSEEYVNLRKKYKTYRGEATTEIQTLTDKISNLKEKYKNYKNEQERDIDLLLKKIENQKEKIEKLEEKSEKETSSLTENNAELREEYDNFKEEKKNEIELLKKKNGDTKTKYEKYKSEKELLVELLLKKQQDMGKKHSSTIREKENEMDLLCKKSQDIRKRYDNYKNESEKEIERLARKNQDLVQKYEMCRSENEEEIGIVLKKNEDIKELFENYKSEKEGKIRMLLKQVEDAKEKFENFQNGKETEIQNLFHWLCQQSTQLTELKAELASRREQVTNNLMKQNNGFEDVTLFMTEKITKQSNAPNKIHPGGAGKPEVIEITDDTPAAETFKSCEILGEYYCENINALKNALKDKIVRIETLKSDIKDLATNLNVVIEEKQKLEHGNEMELKIKQEIINSNDYDPAQPTTINDDVGDELVEPNSNYLGTSETLGGMYVNALKHLSTCKRLNEYYKYIYAQELVTLERHICDKETRLKSYERTERDKEFHIQVLQEEIRKLNLQGKESKPDMKLLSNLNSTPDGNRSCLLPSLNSGSQVVEMNCGTTESEDISIQDSSGGHPQHKDDIKKYKVTGTASYFTKEEMYLLYSVGEKPVSNDSKEHDEDESGNRSTEIVSHGNQNSELGMLNLNPNDLSAEVSENNPGDSKCELSRGKRHSTIPYLKFHLKICKDGRQGICKLCGDKCYRGVYLKGDMKLRLDRNPFQNHECGQCFRKSVNLHKKHDEKSNQNKEVSNEKSHSPRHSRFKRPQSNEPVMNRYTRLKSQVRGNLNDEPFVNNKNIPNENTLNNSKPYNCQLCARSFNLPRTFRNHMATHNIELRDRTQPIYQHPNMNNNMFLKCDVCGKQFNRQWSWKSHMLTHDQKKDAVKIGDGRKPENNVKGAPENMPFSCPQCKKTISWDVVLDGVLGIDFEQKDFKCNHCDFTFSPKDYNISDLKQTGKRLPLDVGVKPEEEIHQTGDYKCDVCNIKFDRIGTMKEHNMRKHSLSSKDYEDHFKPHKDNEFDETVNSDRNMKCNEEKRPSLNPCRKIEYHTEKRPMLITNKFVELNVENRPAMHSTRDIEHNAEKRLPMNWARNIECPPERRPQFNPNRNMSYNKTDKHPFQRGQFECINSGFGRNRFTGRGGMNMPHRNCGPNTGGDDTPLKLLHCYTCGKQFKFFHNLKIHTKMHHAKKKQMNYGFRNNNF